MRQQTLICHKCISKDSGIWHILCELTYATGKWHCSPFPQFTNFDIDSSFAFHWTKQLTATLVVSPEWLGISEKSNVSQTLVCQLASVWCSLLSHSHCNIYTRSPHNKSQHFNNRRVTSQYFNCDFCTRLFLVLSSLHSQWQNKPLGLRNDNMTSPWFTAKLALQRTILSKNPSSWRAPTL